VTIHTSNAGDTAGFDANAAAKAAGATPFKRPENMAWLPGSNFATFFFDPTGDTNATAGGVPELAARGAFGSIFRVDLRPSKPIGRISIFVLGDPEHNSFDNLAFADEKTLLATEDRGEGEFLRRELPQLIRLWRPLGTVFDRLRQD
jgi:secreted PhoX family phosphatase